MEYADRKKDYSYKHIVCFGDSPNNLHHIYFGNEHVNGGAFINVTELNDINSLDKIHNHLSKSNVPFQKIKPMYTNFIPNMFTKFSNNKDNLQRYDMYYKSN